MSTDTNAHELPFRFPELIEAIRADSEEAATALYNHYHGLFRRVLRQRHMPPKAAIRTLYDSNDFLQIAWNTIFEEIKKGRTFPTEKSFVCFCFTVTENVARKGIRDNLTTGKRSLQRQVSLDSSLHEPADLCPDPAEQAEQKDELDHLRRELPGFSQSILQGMLEGENLAELAAFYKISERTAQRIVQQIRKKWQAKQQEQG